MSRARNWSYTLNNYTDSDIALVRGLACVYHICGREVGASGTPHLQGYIELDNNITFSAMQTRLPKAHLEVSKGNAEQNKTYCTKDKNVLLESGTPKRQGKRKDLDQVRDQLADGANMRAVVDSARSLQSIRMAEIYLTYHEEKRNWKPIVKWFYGPTGTGKTKQAYAESEDPFICGNSIKWWQGYDKHEHVIIDDFRTGFCKLEELLKLLDRYAFLVECKGSSRQLLAKQIIITAPQKPFHFFGDTGEDINQLLRRIDEIREFTKDNSIIETA